MKLSNLMTIDFFEDISKIKYLLKLKYVKEGEFYENRF